jgi:hypothetical protein
LNINDFFSLCESIDVAGLEKCIKNRIITTDYVKMTLKNKFPVETLQK